MAQNVVEILIRARDEASKVLKTVQGSVASTAAANKREWAAMTAVSGVALGAITAVGGAAVATGLKFVHLAGQLEMSKIAFETMLGSAEEADAFLRELADFAAATPFDFPGLQNSSRLLLAFGFQAEAVIPIMETLGDATSALGGGTDTLEAVVRALGQMQTKGKVVTQELMQMAERGIPVFDILKEKLEMTGEQVSDIANMGVSTSTVITAILEGLGDRFGGAMEKQSRTLLGLWSTVQDTVSLISTDIGTKLIESLDLTKHMEALTHWLDEIRTRVENLDLRQVWEDGKQGVVVFAGALTAMALPAVINLVRALLPLVTRLGAMALAGALVADVAQKIGIDFSKLSAPDGALPRVGSVIIGLINIFDGFTTGIAALIRGSVQGFGNWVTFFEAAVGVVGNAIDRIVEDALGALEAIQSFDPGAALARFITGREARGSSGGRGGTGGLFGGLKEAWQAAFQGLDEDIVVQFGNAKIAVDTGWEQIVNGFTGNVDKATSALVTNVTDAVSDGAKKIVDWSKLLTGDASPALLDVATSADSASKSITDSATAAAKAAVTWQSALEGIAAAVATHLRDALGVDQPDSPLAQTGKMIVASLQSGFEQAWPGFAARLTAAAEAGRQALAWANRPTFSSAASFAGLGDRQAGRAQAFEESPGLSTLTKLPESEAGVLWNAVAALVAAKAPVDKIRTAVDQLTAVMPLSLSQVHALTGGMLKWSKSTADYAADAEAAAKRVREAFNESAPLWTPDGGLPPAWDLRRNAAAERGRGLGLPALPGTPTAFSSPGMGAADIARDTLQALVETGAGLDQIKTAAEALTQITPLSVTELDKLTNGAYSLAQAAENAAARVDAAWASWADVRAFDEFPGTAWQPEGGLLPVLPELTPRALTDPGAFGVVQPDRSGVPADQMTEILRKEMEARQAVVDELTQMSTEKGPLANFGAALLGAAAGSVPAFGAALDGFVQAGPVGAIIGFFSELLFSSQPMIDAFTMINEALVPLGELLGHILAPALRVLGTVIGWVVDALIAVYNFLLGWLFGKFEKGIYDPREREPERPVHSDLPPAQREMEFGRVGPGIQLAVATPLIEAAQLQLTAASTLQSAAMGLAGSAKSFGDYVARLIEEGISVRVEQRAGPTLQSGTAYLR